MDSWEGKYREALAKYIAALNRYADVMVECHRAGAEEGDEIDELYAEVDQCHEEWLTLDSVEDEIGAAADVDEIGSGSAEQDLSIFLRWDVRLSDARALAESLGVEIDETEDGFDIDLVSHAFLSLEEPDLSGIPGVTFVRSAFSVGRSAMEDDEDFISRPFAHALDDDLPEDQ